MIKNKVYRLKESVEINNGIKLPAGQEIEIVMDVVYINGNIVPPAFQKLFFEWLEHNKTLLIDDTRNW